MVAFWVDYWSRNRNVLLDGAFTAEAPLANYPVIRASRDGVEIIARYADHITRLSGEPRSRIDIVNASSSSDVALSVASDMGSYRTTVIDVSGVELAYSPITLGAGLHALSVPRSGMVTLALLP